MYMQKYIMFLLVIISMNNYTMKIELNTDHDTTIKCMMKNFHQKIEKQIELFKTQSELSGYLKKFNALKPYQSCLVKQDYKVSEFFLFVSPEIISFFVEGVKPSSDTEFVNFLKFYHLLNQVNKKFKIQEQWILDMCNTKFDIPLDDKQKKDVLLETEKPNISNIHIDSVKLTLDLKDTFCIYTKFFKKISTKTIKHYYGQVNETGQIIYKKDGTSLLGFNNK